MRRRARMAEAAPEVGRLGGCFVIGAGALLGGIAIAAEDAKIMLNDFKFSQEPMTIAAGSTITWSESRRHSPTVLWCPRLGIRSRPMNKEQLFAFRLDKPGTYDSIQRPASHQCRAR